jgi:hypothetical protein
VDHVALVEVVQAPQDVVGDVGQEVLVAEAAGADQVFEGATVPVLEGEGEERYE